MSKYTAVELREMAMTVIEFWMVNDPRYPEFMKRLSAETGLSIKECERRMMRMAGY